MLAASVLEAADLAAAMPAAVVLAAAVTMSLAPKTRTPTSGLFARFPKAFFLRFDEPILGTIGNRHILDVGRPTFFFSCGLYSSLERSSVPPLSGRFSLVRAREGGLRGKVLCIQVVSTCKHLGYKHSGWRGAPELSIGAGWPEAARACARKHS